MSLLPHCLEPRIRWIGIKAGLEFGKQLARDGRDVGYADRGNARATLLVACGGPE